MLRVKHSEPANEPTQSGDEYHGNQSLKDRLEHCCHPCEGISDAPECHFSYCGMLMSRSRTSFVCPFGDSAVPRQVPIRSGTLCKSPLGCRIYSPATPEESGTN